MHKVEHLQCRDVTATSSEIIQCIFEGHSVMILLRGIPGSGKSETARYLRDISSDCVICSTDDYFYDKNGEYRFDPNLLDEYHKKNIGKVRDAMQNHRKLIIVDNTNLLIEHMKPYVYHAVKNFYEIYVLEPETAWKYKPAICAEKNIHGISKNSIKQKLELMELEGKVDLQTLVGKTTPIRLEQEDNHTSNESQFSSVGGNMGSNMSSPGLGSSFPLLPPPGFDTEPDPTFFGLLEPTELLPASTSPSPCEDYKAISNEKGFLSLSHHVETPLKVIEQRSVQTQFSQVMISLNEAGIPCDYPEFTYVETTVRKIRDGCKPERVERPSPTASDSVRMPDINNFDILVALFPEEQVEDLQHYYERSGMNNLVRMYHEVGAASNHNAVVNKIEIASSKTHSSPHDSHISDKSEKIDVNEDKKIQVKLSDLKMILSILFGTGDGSDVPDYLTIHLSLLMFLYKQCQIDIEENSLFDNSEEQYAMRLESEFSGEKKPTRLSTIAQRMQYLKLIEDYPSVDSNRLFDLFIDNNMNSEHTRAILSLEFEDYHTNTPKLNVQKGPILPCRPKTMPSVTNAFSKAREEACRLFAQADTLSAKKKQELSKVKQLGPKSNSTIYYSKMASDFGRDEKRLREAGNQILRDANLNSKVLDFHMMTTKDALETLKDKLRMCDSSNKNRKAHETKKLLVITGSGNSEGSRGAIKNSVIDYLTKHKYLYSFDNPGAITIYCK